MLDGVKSQSSSGTEVDGVACVEKVIWTCNVSALWFVYFACLVRLFYALLLLSPPSLLSHSSASMILF